MQDRVGEGGSVGGNHIKRYRCHGHHHHSDQNDAPIGAERAEDFWHAGFVCACVKFVSFGKGAPESKKERNNGAAQKQRYAPSPSHHFWRRQYERERNSKQRRE